MRKTEIDAPAPAKLHGPDAMRGVSQRTAPASFHAPLILFLLSLAAIAAVWSWLAAPAAPGIVPIGAARKLDCVSYAPFRMHQTPWNSAEVIGPEQIAEDLATLSRLSECIRIYSVENGLDRVPELAAKAGLKVILGIWIGRDVLKNAALLDTAVSLVNTHPETITALIVGSEVLLRGEMSAADLRRTIRAAKARVGVPVSYADVPEFWWRYPDVAREIDFVTVHVLPYWEDVPLSAEEAAAHVVDVHRQMAAAFPDKEILVGEAGWPSRGRMRGVALPSRINQARFVSDLAGLARREHMRVNLFEAYDEPWKQQWEGTVGGHWGLLDGFSRRPKFPPGAYIRNYPSWKLQLGTGLVFSALVFAAAWSSRDRTSPMRWTTWIAVATSATIGGCLVGIVAERTLLESYALAGWFNQTLLLAVAIAAPLACVMALMSDRPLPTFAELLGPPVARPGSRAALILGAILIATVLVATETALGLVFDPRGRDFAFASLTMAVMPLGLVELFNGRKPEASRTAEATFAVLLAAAALYISLHEGLHNWQALWTSFAYAALGGVLWLPHAAVARLLNRSVAGSQLSGSETGVVQPVAVVSQAQRAASPAPEACR